MKKVIKKIPIIGDLGRSIYRKLKGIKSFKTSEKYWEENYKKGGNSGEGSYNNLAEFKAEVINEFVNEKKVLSVIEFGCGDGNQLRYFQFKSYLGYDVSRTVIQKCSADYANDKTKKFKIIDSSGDTTSDLTLSLDVIYHLVEDDTFNLYMERLFKASNKFVIIYSSNLEETTRSVPHVRHRKFDEWVKVNASNF